MGPLKVRAGKRCCDCFVQGRSTWLCICIYLWESERWHGVYVCAFCLSAFGGISVVTVDIMLTSSQSSLLLSLELLSTCAKLFYTLVCSECVCFFRSQYVQKHRPAGCIHPNSPNWHDIPPAKEMTWWFSHQQWTIVYFSVANKGQIKITVYE